MIKQDMQEGRARAIENSARLFEDAKLLIEHSRFAGAFKVAVLGLEEIGRVILDTWNAVEPLPKPKVRRTAHELKKMAVGSVLLASFAIREFGLPVGEISDELIEQVGSVFQDSWEGQLLESIGFSVLEQTKPAGLNRESSYADLDSGLLSREDAECVFEIAKFLLDLLLDGNAMQAGLGIYNTAVQSYTTFRN
jgi:AbiV family abortive infection protein